MARDAVSIYVDDSAIRVLGLSGRRPKQWFTEPLDAGLVRDGLIVDEAEVARRIRALWAAQGIGARRVVAGISGINCLYRYITLPELPGGLLQEAVSREASRAFGMPVDQLYIAWQALPSKPGETLAYVVASSRNTVDGLIRTLRQAGLNPYLMDVSPIAICRAVAETNALIIDLQPSTLDIIVKMDGLPEVIRSIAVPSGDLEEASLTITRQELQRAMTFYNSGHADKPIADAIPILVAGRLTEKPELWPKLLGMVERRIEPVKTPVDEADGFAAQSYLPAIGLGLKESAGKGATPYARINFNALPLSYQPKPRPMSELLYPPALAVSIACVVLGGYFVLNSWHHTQALKDEAVALNQLALSLGEQLSGRRQALEAEQAALMIETEDKEVRTTELERELRNYDTTKAEINVDLGEIHRTPSSINLEKVTHDISVINVSGWGGTEESIFSYARQLRASGRFEYVVITSMAVDGIKTAFDLVLYKDTLSID
ncbi:MAG: pilus assembly protein PilM [Dehalococcoidia bacterium]|nr:pilus assembly protein PilM [Dehalococcoidia bacterium]